MPEMDQESPWKFSSSQLKIKTISNLSEEVLSYPLMPQCMCVVLDWDTSGLRNSEESRGFKDKWQIGLHVNPPPPSLSPKKKKGQPSSVQIFIAKILLLSLQWPSTNSKSPWIINKIRTWFRVFRMKTCYWSNCCVHQKQFLYSALQQT